MLHFHTIIHHSHLLPKDGAASRIGEKGIEPQTVRLVDGPLSSWATAACLPMICPLTINSVVIQIIFEETVCSQKFGKSWSHLDKCKDIDGYTNTPWM